MKKNLLTLSDLSVEEINDYLNLADDYSKGKTHSLKGKKVVNLFFENSTRTLYSFVMAEHNLGMDVINFATETSSVQKGETLYDTVKTFESIGADAFVIRHSQNRYFEELEGINVPIANGGDGTGNHPTQSLLDLLTIKQEFGKFEGLKIAIVGDIMHSRVAHTNIDVMKRLGMEVYISGPEVFNDGSAEYIDFDKAIKEMDVVMLLRVQLERHPEHSRMLNDDYLENFGLTKKRYDIMKDNAIIMHPAPFNRGIEICDEVVEAPKSRIFKQMENGVYVRMAVLETLLKK